MYLKVIDGDDSNRFKTYKKNYNWSFEATNALNNKTEKTEALEMTAF